MKELLTYGVVFCSVEHSSKKDGSELLISLQIKKKNKELTVESQNKYNSLKGAVSDLKSQKHIVLVINNQQVLFKKLDSVYQIKEQAVKAAFPSVKISDFYYQVLINESQTYVALCRKEYIHRLVAKYKAEGISVVDFSLHNLSVSILSSYVNQDEIHTSNAVLKYKNNELIEITKEDTTQQNYSINNLELSNQYILPFTGLLTAFWSENKTISNFGTYQNELSKEYYQQRFYSLGIKTALGFVFTILLLNFMIFSSSYSEMNQLNNEIQVNSSYKSTLIRLQSRVDKKKELSKNRESLSSSRTSWYLHELGKSVPKKVQLTSLTFQPLTKSIKKNKRILVNENNIIIKGISKDDHSFTNWFSKLELENWIEEVVVSYGKGKKKNADFEFLIKIKN